MSIEPWRETSGNIPLPTTPLPPDIYRPHSRIRQIQRRTPQTPYPVHHPPTFRSHSHKTLNLARHVSPRDISSILPPLTCKDTPPRRRGRHRGDGVTAERQPARATGVIQPGASADTGREHLIHGGGVDDADNWAVVDEKPDRDAERGEEVGEVDGSFSSRLALP